jgi:2-methylcitrate dehydratase PrpD
VEVPETIAERLGTYVATMTTASLDEDVTDKAVSCLLDGIGLALQARGERTCQAFLSTLLRTDAAAGSARVWQDGSWAIMPESVTVNSMAVHGHLQDDADMDSWGHPGSLIVPAAVGVAESVGASLGVTLRSIVAGYSIMQWLGRSVGRGMLDRGFRTSPTYGPIGAAASASVALGLAPKEASQALSLAAAVSGGVTGTTQAGFADWRFQNASASWLGVTAARIAASGGGDDNPEIFEGTNGFLQKFAGLEPPVVLAGEPSPRSILTAWSKPYPVGLQNVAVVAAALKVRRDNALDVAQVERICVYQNSSFAVPGGPSYRGPFEWPKQAIGSTAFAVSTALAHGEPQFRHLVDHHDDPIIIGLIERLEIIPDEDFGFLDARVEVETKAGAHLTADASDLPITLFHRDRRTTGEVLDGILIAAGAEPGRGIGLSEAVFDSASSGGKAGITQVLDEILGAVLAP